MVNARSITMDGSEPFVQLVGYNPSRDSLIIFNNGVTLFIAMDPGVFFFPFDGCLLSITPAPRVISRLEWGDLVAAAWYGKVSAPTVVTCWESVANSKAAEAAVGWPVPVNELVTNGVPKNNGESKQCKCRHYQYTLARAESLAARLDRIRSGDQSFYAELRGLGGT